MADHTPAMYAFCGAFFAELRAAGLEDVVVSPGSRSTPLVVSADRAGLRLHVQLDERSAGFFALGLAKGSRRAVGLICTSGTAAANYLPAVVEAHHSGVPLLVLTADRPPELRGWGANQTIDQVRLYGTNVRWYAEMPVASEGEPAVARRFAARASALATGTPRGPVHLNWRLREPLEPDAGVPLVFEPPATPIRAVGTGASDAESLRTVVDVITAYERGVIVAGPMDPGTIAPEDVHEVARRSGWPVLAEPTSQLRTEARDGAPIVSTTAHLLRVEEFTSRHRPDAVLRVGGSPTATVLCRWLQEVSPERTMLLNGGGAWSEASFTLTDMVRVEPGRAFSQLRDELPPLDGRASWPESWLRADAAAAAVVAAAVTDGPLLEPAVVRTLARALPAGASLYVSNSMPVRDLDLFWSGARDGIEIYANRGASGIDGLVSSALGVAASGRDPVVLLTGDLALLHDLGGLLAAARLGLPLTTVVVNNDGGGIFSLLPIAELGESVRFRELFHTPHGADLGTLVRGAGVEYGRATDRDGLDAALAAAMSDPAPWVIEVAVDAAAEAAAHRVLGEAVRASLILAT